MPFIYRCQFLGDEWSEWDDGFEMPPLPDGFTQEECTITFHSHDGVSWCFAYTPFEDLITWCNKESDGWSDWHDIAPLPSPPNWIIDDEEGIPSNFSVGTHMGQPVMYSYHPDDDSVFVSSWSDDEFTDWIDLGNLEPPPNLSEASDVFVAADENNEWFISVNLEDWSIYYCEWDASSESFSAWAEAPELTMPDEWYEMGGIDVDGDADDGSFWIYATIYQDDYPDDEFDEF